MSETELAGPYQQGEGLEWLCPVEAAFGFGDGPEAPTASTLVLLEDGFPLGPPHASHADVATLGAGRFSHWAGWLRFSTSDGSDPNRNGRRYAARLEAPRPAVVGLGSCNLHASLRRLAATAEIEAAWGEGLSFSPGETLTLLRWDAGELDVDSSLEGLAVSYARRGSLSFAVRRARAVVVELSGTTDIAVDRQVVIRTEVDRVVLGAFRGLGEEAYALAKRWYTVGLLKADEEVRVHSAAALEALIARSPAEDDAVVRLLREARPLARSMAETIRALEDIGERLGQSKAKLLISHSLYLPGGRGVSWEPGATAKLAAAAKAAALPVLLAADVVQEFGSATPVKGNFIHFEPALEMRLAKRLLTLMNLSDDAPSR